MTPRVSRTCLLAGAVLLEQEWEQQRLRLEPRVQEADARYQALLDRAAATATSS